MGVVQFQFQSLREGVISPSLLVDSLPKGGSPPPMTG